MRELGCLFTVCDVILFRSNTARITVNETHLGTNYTLVNKTSGELTLVPGDMTLRLGETAGYLIFVTASSFVLFNLLKISVINSFNPFSGYWFCGAIRRSQSWAHGRRVCRWRHGSFEPEWGYEQRSFKEKKEKRNENKPRQILCILGPGYSKIIRSFLYFKEIRKECESPSGWKLFKLPFAHISYLYVVLVTVSTEKSSWFHSWTEQSPMINSCSKWKTQFYHSILILFSVQIFTEYFTKRKDIITSALTFDITIESSYRIK